MVIDLIILQILPVQLYEYVYDNMCNNWSGYNIVQYIVN